MSTTSSELRIEKGKIWCELVQEFRKDQPEERVRQNFIHLLHHRYGYAYAQMRQEQRTQSGTRSPRIDIAVWATAEAAAQKPRSAPVLVVECKAETVDIHARDYFQGESYARAVGDPCEFLVMHNQRQTSFFRLVRGLPGGLVPVTDLPKAEDWGDAQKLRKIREAQRAFKRKEFQDLLFECHTILRDVQKANPLDAFDAISKILFTKMYVERTGTHGTFTTEYLDQRAKNQLTGENPVHEVLFDLTKKYYQTDDLFAADEKLNVAESTFRRIVDKLQKFNLSATGDDVKGLAFEQFLGRTFRGNLGQYFTPRPVVEFMVGLLDPQENELVCDPTAGSGGFLINAFEHVRRQIEDDINRQKDDKKLELEALGLPEDEEIKRIEAAFARLNRELVLHPEADKASTRLSRLSRDCIFGTDAEATAARTAKMNMIMHGDGHGGIHYHDGLLDINGIFRGRFDVVLSNPPFGSTVGEDQLVDSTEQTRVPTDQAYIDRCKERYGAPWEAAYQRLLNAANATTEGTKEGKTKILDLFETGKGKPARPTELLFLERIVELLRPGGRAGIVLPDGNLNNPSLGWLRRWAEGRARLLAVVSLPPETFVGAKASVKASLVFLQRFTEADEDAWNGAWVAAHAALDPDYAYRRSAITKSNSAELTGEMLPALEPLLAELTALEAGRTAPGWRLQDPPAYPRGVMRSAI
ncbi:MAG: N-6 DNA methylase, partial [Hymenobacter sp.]|nr:N-6 DNA methylase [Hymenobacter sp.]